MRAFKGFHRNTDGTISCRGFKYELGETYKYNGDIELCKRGFHACHELNEVWKYYPNNGYNVFCEVECGGQIIENDNYDGKFVCSEITILCQVDTSNVDIFDFCDDFFFGGYAVVQKDGFFNYIRKNGTLLTKRWWKSVRGFSCGFAMVESKNGKFNFVRENNGKILSRKWFISSTHFREEYGTALVLENKGRRYQVLDSKGKLSEWR